MVFSSLEFVFAFLPIFLCIYYIVPKKIKNFTLLLGSFAFYVYGAVDYPTHIALLLASILVNFTLAKLSAPGKKARKFFFVIDLLYNFLWLGLFKYSGFVSENINQILTYFGKAPITVPVLVLPLGISFYTFQIVSYVIDVYKGTIKEEDSIVSLGAYLCMFPQLIAGPIVTYSEVSAQMKDRTLSFNDFNEGLKDFTVGLGLKVLLANRIGNLWNDVNVIGYQSISTPLAWMGIIAYTLQIYFDFYGYSLMAIGLGRMLGFKIPENFDHPYVSLSMTEFWRRWHITLGSWFREYVYIPLGGNRKGNSRTYFNLFVTWALTGVWHGAAWNFVLWGLLFGILLMVEKWVPALQKLPNLLRHGYVLLIVCLSFVLFNADSLSQALSDMGGMFGFAGVPLVNAESLYYLRSYAPLFLMAFAGATPVVRDTARKIGEKSWGAVLEVVLMAVLLIVCSAYLVDGSFSPFLYFRF